jgi:adhesin transport system membrane fusion protein
MSDWLEGIDQEDIKQVGLSSLQYESSKVSWAISEHIASENPKMYRVLVYLLLSAAIIFVLYARFTKVSLGVQANGKLEYDNASITVLNKSDIVVHKILVKDSDMVEKDTVLLVAKKQLPEQWILQALKAKNAFLEALESREECSGECLKNLEHLQNTTFGSFGSLALETEFLEHLKQLNAECTQVLSDLNSASSSGSVTQGIKERLKQVKDKLKIIKAKKAEKLLAMEVDNLTKEMSDLKSQLEEKKLNTSNQVNQSINKFKLTLRNLEEKIQVYTAEHEIRAPQKGLIKFENIGGEGELISARTKVFQLLPGQSNLMAKLLIPNKDISEIEKGNTVRISVDALPDKEYGAVTGVIKKIGIIPIEGKDGSTGGYYAEVELNKQSLTSSFGLTKSFKYGMTLNGKVITRYRSLLNVMVTKLLSIKEEYLGDLI